MPSKFARVIALSKKPSDYPLKESKGTVPSVGTVPSKGTVPRVYRCSTVQEGHSFAEDRLYNALWNYRNAKVESDDTRLVTVGWNLMAKLSGMTDNNARQNCFRLVRKLALEVAAGPIINARIGTTYRVYSFAAILRRRREAGMEWITRNRGGVAFVADPESTKGTVPLEGTVPTVGTDTVPTEGRPSSHIEVTEIHPSSAISLISERVRKLITIDDDAVSQIIDRCRQQDPAATADEIAHFTEAKIFQHRHNSAVKNLPGLLIRSVRDYFRPGSGELADYRSAQAQERARNRELARQILGNPNSDEQEKKWAREIEDAFPGETRI